MQTSETGAPEVIQLDEVVIEGSLLTDTVRNTPKNVSVITSWDIERHPGTGLLDLLSSQAGIHITSYSGQEKQSSVDLRGMGATANSNVLIIVDDVRINAPDLSGADLSSLPLESIEKIEVIRGPEAVIYGDGAVGGVIRIYTGKKSAPPATTVHGGIGSFGSREAMVNHRSGYGDLSWNAGLEAKETDGYRENGDMEKTNGRLRLRYDLSDRIAITLSSSLAADRYGLPGPVSIDDIDSEEKRRQSSNPDDEGRTRDLRLNGEIHLAMPGEGKLLVRRGYRLRENDYLLGYNPVSNLSREQQTAHIVEASKTLQIQLTRPYSFNTREHRIKLGLEQARSYYVRESMTQNRRHNSNIIQLGAFLANRWQFTDTLHADIGYRWNRLNARFREDSGQFYENRYYWGNGTLLEKEWRNESMSLGFLFKGSGYIDVFTTAANSFRTPNVDEFARADNELKPQHGTHIEAGLRRTAGEGPGFSASVFQMRIENEIHFGIDPDTGETENRNYGQTTMRRGIEAEINGYLGNALYFWGNGTLLSARFEGDETTVPLVPSYKTTIGGEWTATDDITLSLKGTHVAERYDGNDDTNRRFEKLDAYTVVNSKLTWRWLPDKTVTFGINNLFDERYSTVAYSETYYPMPTRNIYAKLKWQL